MEGSDIMQECVHNWVMTNETPRTGKEWKVFPNGEKREVYYHVYKCSKCGLKKEMSEHDANTNNFEDGAITEIIKKVVGTNDIFWQQTLEKYFNSLKGITTDEKIAFLVKLTNKKEIFNEFTKEIVKNEDSQNLYEKYIKILSEEKNNLSNINIDNIVNNVVKEIESMEDNATTSISALINNNEIDKKIMFGIYDAVVKSLKDRGLYLNFGQYENQRVGLPFNIPFKKGYSKQINISQRIYNGHYGKGSIFNEIINFSLSGGNAFNHTQINFCIDPKVKDKAVIETTIPFEMNEMEINDLNDLITYFSENYESYIKDENVKVSISPEYYNYVEVSINGTNYSINKNDENLQKLYVLIKSTLSKQAIAKSYDELIKNNS